jgi:hypothetical protein
MNWKEYILQLNPRDINTIFHFNTRASDNLLAELKKQFDLTELPGELEQFYNEMNGVDEMLGGHKISELVWSIDRVIETNKSYRNNRDFKDLYMSFNQLLFIADGGNGDLFGYSKFD